MGTNTKRKGSATLPAINKQVSRTKSARRRRQSRWSMSQLPTTPSSSVPDTPGVETAPSPVKEDPFRTTSPLAEDDTGAYDVSVSKIIFLKTRTKSLPQNADIISCHANGVLRFWNTLTAELLGEFTAYPNAESITAAVDE